MRCLHRTIAQHSKNSFEQDNYARSVFIVEFENSTTLGGDLYLCRGVFIIWYINTIKVISLRALGLFCFFV